MKLLVFGIGNCGSKIAGEFSELNKKARAERRTQIVTNSYAINNDQADIASLKNSYQRVADDFCQPHRRRKEISQSRRRYNARRRPPRPSGNKTGRFLQHGCHFTCGWCCGTFWLRWHSCNGTAAKRQAYWKANLRTHGPASG